MTFDIDVLFTWISIITIGYIIFYSRTKNRKRKYLTEDEKYLQSLENSERKVKSLEKVYGKAEAKLRVPFEKEQKKKGLIKFVGEDEEEKWGTPEQVKKWKEIDIGLTSNFFDMDPFEFEKFIGRLFEKMGYRDVRVTRKTGDFGIDVVAKKSNSIYAIQVKRQKNPVGNEVVQNTLGSMSKYNATRAMVITNSRFTKQAIEQARSDKRIELWDKEKLHEVVRKYFL